jgi:ribonuclease I
LYKYDPKEQEASVSMLNQVFYVVFDDMGTWPAMNRLYCESAADVRNLAGSDWPAIPESDSGAAQEAVPRMSKTLVAYVEGLLATTPYRHAADARAAGLAEAQFKTYHGLFNTIDNTKWKDYLMRKLGEWLEDCPRVVEPELSREGAAEGGAADPNDEPRIGNAVLD